ncbi:protein-tyrosine phosphatase-like protein [Lineolata rhizophorae]|uniref:protein-tyrosine-phosphatase n=1 Tax=Lineolata rhizophorae TaxID=578093 RepID=A0A6A6PCF1_9PEZI|nr:protein-tyrosine phosphatase-like protein [Lineolata rhizophorae]
MSLLDKVPGDLRLYIGGLFTLRRKQALQEANITHVLSVLKLPLDQGLFRDFRHMVVEVDDDDDEDLLQHFPATNQFIQEGLDGGGGVLVHCAMGKSRSATCVVAFLMQKYLISPSEALDQIQQSRPSCDPNEGFKAQLELYHRMNYPKNVEESYQYQKWLYQREVEASNVTGQAPEADKIVFEDELSSPQCASVEFELRCRKCRRALANSGYLVRHVPTGINWDEDGMTIDSSEPSPSGCAHHFVEPLSWMRSELEQGKLDGRLECPKCKTNVGKYAWQGMQCSCGHWVVPGISLTKSRVDEVKPRREATATMRIRKPPGSQNL